MDENEGAKQWQVTCVCGWRTNGTKDDVVAAGITQGKDPHDQDLTAGQACSQAVPAGG